MKQFCIILCMAISMLTNTVNAQQKQAESNSLFIKYDLISLMGDQVTTSMGVKLGIEIPTGVKTSLETDLMYIFPCQSCGKAYTSIQTSSTNGFLISSNYRFYLYQGKADGSGFHLGQQMEYQYTVSDLDETYDEGIANTYKVYRNLFALHALAGYRLKIAGPLYFNPSAGIGIRYISSWNKGKKGNGSGQYEFFYNKDFESGSKFFPSVLINLKIGLKL